MVPQPRVGGEVTITQLSAALRARITITGDCWLWTGASCKGAPTYGGSYVKRDIWHTLTGEILHPSEAVFSECGHKACVHPDHQRIGAQVGVPA